MNLSLLTFQQVQERLGNRSRSSIYRDIDAGRIPKPRKIGSRLYWDSAALEEAINALPEAQLAPAA